MHKNTVNWQPDELVDVGDDCQCGITTDDHCYVVMLPKDNGSWEPTPWIPKRIAERLGQLANHCIQVSTSQ